LLLGRYGEAHLHRKANHVAKRALDRAQIAVFKLFSMKWRSRANGRHSAIERHKRRAP
jgi:hypothetical protein